MSQPTVAQLAAMTTFRKSIQVFLTVLDIIAQRGIPPDQMLTHFIDSSKRLSVKYNISVFYNTSYTVDDFFYYLSKVPVGSVFNVTENDLLNDQWVAYLSQMFEVEYLPKAEQVAYLKARLPLINCNITGIKSHVQFSCLFSHYSQPSKKILVYFIGETPNKNPLKSDIEKFCEMYNINNCTGQVIANPLETETTNKGCTVLTCSGPSSIGKDIILVSEKDFTPNAASGLVASMPGLDLTFFSYDELAFNILHHAHNAQYVIKHIPNVDNQVAKWREQENLVNNKLPQQLESFPVAKYYGARQGDVFEYESPGILGTAERSYSARAVVRPNYMFVKAKGK